MLVRMLRESSPLSHVQARRLVRAVLAGAETDLPLRDPSLIQAIRHALQSIGADVHLVPPSKPNVATREVSSDAEER
jgi:hypothetical protein